MMAHENPRRPRITSKDSVYVLFPSVILSVSFCLSVFRCTAEFAFKTSIVDRISIKGHHLWCQCNDTQYDRNSVSTKLHNLWAFVIIFTNFMLWTCEENGMMAFMPRSHALQYNSERNRSHHFIVGRCVSVWVFVPFFSLITFTRCQHGFTVGTIQNHSFMGALWALSDPSCCWFFSLAIVVVVVHNFFALVLFCAFRKTILRSFF